MAGALGAGQVAAAPSCDQAPRVKSARRSTIRRRPARKVPDMTTLASSGTRAVTARLVQSRLPVTVTM